jgi:predicted DsbA family dithiol-disulfide isomerase
MGTIERMHKLMRIDIFSDTVCPWCYLSKRRFELALGQRPQYEPRIIWRAFELNLDLPLEGVERAWYVANRVGDPARFAQTQESLTALGAAAGIEFRFDLIDRVPNTRRSHLLILHARRFGLQSEIKERILRAYFQEGCDIGEIDELVRLGVEAGLAENDTRNAIVLRVGQDSVIAAERHASALGITGVPTFVFDGLYTTSGAQEVETLTRVLDQVAEYAAARDPNP